MYGYSGSKPHAYRKREGWSPGSARPLEVEDTGKEVGPGSDKLEVKTEERDTLG